MARTLKHVGKMKNTGMKVLVVFRTLPGESNTALVLPVAQLPDAYHDSIMTLVESEEAQQSFEFGEMMFVRMFPDGRQMLRAVQQDGRLAKVATDTVIMTPTPTSEVSLDQLNVLIAEQRNCAVDDLCTFVKGAPQKTEVKEVARVQEVAPTPTAQAPLNAALSDTDIAKSLRSQADSLYKEAARMRKEADSLDPPKKKTTTKTEEQVDA